MFYLNCFLLLFLISTAYGIEEPVQVGFSQFEEAQKFDGKKIQIRGFLYRSTKNNWILASEPNLKSCCVGSESKKSHQLLLIGEMSLESSQVKQVAELEGIFHVGKSNEGFFLENPIAIKSTRKSLASNLYLLGLGLLLAAGIGFKIMKTLKKV